MNKVRISIYLIVLCGAMFGIFWPRTRHINDIYQVIDYGQVDWGDTSQVVNYDQLDWKDVKIDGKITYTAINILLKYGQMEFTGNITIDDQTFLFSYENRLPVFPPKHERPSKYTFFLIQNNVGNDLANFLGVDFVLGEYDKENQNIELSYNDSHGNSLFIDLNRCS